MLRRGNILVAILALTSVVCLAGAAREESSQGNPAPPHAIELVYKSLIPLGSESFEVKPWNSVLTVLASAESPEFAGWRRESVGDSRGSLLDRQGEPIRYFPGEVQFRITAGTRTRLAGSEPFPLRTSVSENDYLLNLRFRVAVFHGLHKTLIQPSSVAVIGVPGYVQYNERIFRVGFDLGRVPVNDRVVLEVLAPGGERLCKFHLDLM